MINYPNRRRMVEDFRRVGRAALLDGMRRFDRQGEDPNASDFAVIEAFPDVELEELVAAWRGLAAEQLKEVKELREYARRRRAKQ